MKQLKAQFHRLAQSAAAKGAAVTGGLVIAGSALAEGPDVSSVTTAIAAAGVAIGLVGAAYLTMRVGGRVWKWISSAL